MSEASASLPAGLLIRAQADALAADFADAAELQPVAWTDDGLLCAPRAAGDPARAARALAGLTHSREPRDGVPGWPEPPSGWMGGWYRRSPAHAPAPPGVPELIQTSGEGFGAAGHPTTALCLSLLAQLPHGPALDAGCGSGLLTQAWIALDRGPVNAADLDPAALRHCRDSLTAAGRSGDVRLTRTALGALGGADLDGRVLLANIPAVAHRELLPRIGDGTDVALIAGPGPDEMDEIATGYATRGLRVRDRAADGRWQALIVERP